MARVVHSSTGNVLPATKSRLSKPWNEIEKESARGQGLMVEGTIKELRVHTVYDGSTYTRFLAVVAKVDKARNRIFDANTGEEREVEDERKRGKRTGYAKWEFGKTESKDILNVSQVAQRLGAWPTSWDNDAPRLARTESADTFEFWAPAEDALSKELKVGHVVRIKTRGASRLIETVWNRDSNAVTEGTSYAGEDLGDNWSSKILSPRKGPEPEPVTHSAEKDGVSDDEWDD